MAYGRYKPGGVITSLDELAKQDVVFNFGSEVHASVFMFWQMHLASHYINTGSVRYAIKSEEKDWVNDLWN